MILIATPTVILSDLRLDSQQMVALVALFAGALTFVEYNSVYPGLVEFRDAPPFNRMRFLMLFATVFCLSLIERGRDDRLDHDRAGRMPLARSSAIRWIFPIARCAWRR